MEGPPESRTPKAPWYERVAPFLHDFGWRALALLCSVGLALLGLAPVVNPGLVGQPWELVCTILVAFGVVTSGAMDLLRAPRITRLLEENSRLQDSLEQVATDHRGGIEQIIGRYFAQRFEGNHRVRITAYRHNGGVYLFQGRYSLNQEFRERHRDEYPDNQGVLAEVRRSGEVAESDLPDPRLDRKAYESFHYRTWDVPREVVKNFTMKPRSYVAAAIWDGHPRKCIGAVVIESTLPDGLGEDDLADLRSSDLLGELASYMKVMAWNEPRLSLARERGL